MNQRDRLIEILREKSVRTGQFVLASGKESDLYVDARQTTLNAEGAFLVAELILEQLHSDIVAIGGPVTGADPIAGAAAALSWKKGTPIHSFMVRKEPKGHGTQVWVEGQANMPKGSKVCMVEDTVTTGGSLLKAIERVEEAGYQVAQTIVVVDRCEGASERLQSAGHEMLALVTRRDLV